MDQWIIGGLVGVVEDEDFISFVRTSIRSVWALEVLLLMKRDPRAWPVADLTRELRANPSLVEGVLGNLEVAGLVRQVESGYLFQPASQFLHECCEQLERAYNVRPVAIVNLIIESASGRLKDFADAFRLRRDD